MRCVRSTSPACCLRRSLWRRPCLRRSRSRTTLECLRSPRPTRPSRSASPRARAFLHAVEKVCRTSALLLQYIGPFACRARDRTDTENMAFKMTRTAAMSASETRRRRRRQCGRSAVHACFDERDDRPVRADGEDLREGHPLEPPRLVSRTYFKDHGATTVPRIRDAP